DLVAAGVVTSADQVYTGRRRKATPNADCEVWLEFMPSESASTGFEALTRYPVIAHVFVTPFNAGPDRTGRAQFDRLEAKLHAIAERYHGARPHALSLDLMSVEAVVDEVDADPEETARMEGTVRLVYETTATASEVLLFP